MSVILIGGSPQLRSRSGVLLSVLAAALQQQGLATQSYQVRDFAAEDLLFGRFEAPPVQAFQAAVAAAEGVVVATPVYKASFSGALKTLLDLLPQQALQHKVVLPIASAGSPAHLLALDYALKPVLSAMKAQEIIAGVFAEERQIHGHEAGVRLDDELHQRLQQAAAQMALAIRCRRLRQTINLPEYSI